MLLIMTFAKEIKSVVTEKHHSDNRDESFLITTFWKIWTIKILMLYDQNQWFSNRIFLYRSRIFNWDFDWWIQTWSCWENSVWIMRYINNDGISQIFRNMGIVTQHTKPTICKGSTLLQVELFWLKPKWKKMSFVFLKKSELQRRGNSILIALLGIPSIWGSQNDIFE